MPHRLPVPLVEIFRQLDGSPLVMAESLGLAQLARLGDSPKQARRHLMPHWVRWQRRAEAADRARHAWTTAPRAWTLRLTLTPPSGAVRARWSEPLPARFLVVEWLSPAGPRVGHLPELGLTVLAGDADELRQRLKVETLEELKRRDLLASLQDLHWLQRTTRHAVRTSVPKVGVPTLKDRLRADRIKAERKQPSTLKKVAADWVAESPPPAWGVEERVARLAETLAAQPPRAVLLVGPSGVGKTTVARELARRRRDFHLGEVPFFATTGSRLVAGMTGFGMWQQRCTELVREADKLKAVLHLGSLAELIEVGRSEHQSQSIAQFLRPAIASGQLLAVAEATPEQIPFLEQADAALLEAFERVDIPEPPPAETEAIFRQAADHLSAGSGALARLTDEGVTAVDRLHRRYAAYSALPGRALRFIDNLLRDADEPELGRRQVLAAFSRETGLPLDLLDPERPLDVDALRDWFSARVVGQGEAVGRVVDMLVTVKAQLTRPDRPIASLLFIGPTGVGKTELAKALAEYLFGTRRRLTRFDMSEYAQPGAAVRLIGGPGGEGLLTATVREQPFSVLLFDEFEKADPAVFDLFLQMLGEARLTDKAGRLADFRNCVIIFTSNLGAESYQRGRVGLEGITPQSGTSAEFFTRAVEEFLRPEMVNRLDQIIPFSALGRSELRQVARRELRHVARRDGLARLSLDAAGEEEFIEKLLDQVGETKYGARPLKRALESRLLVPLAERLIHPETRGRSGTVRLGWADGGPQIEVAMRPREAAEQTSPRDAVLSAAAHLRRDSDLLGRGSIGRDLRNDLTRLERAQNALRDREKRGKKLPSSFWLDEVKLTQLRALADGIGTFHTQAADFEEMLLLRRQEELTQPQSAEEIASYQARQKELDRDWDGLLERIFLDRVEAADYLTLSLIGSDTDFLLDLADAYARATGRLGLHCRAAYYLPPGQHQTWPNDPASRQIKPGKWAWVEDWLVHYPEGAAMEAVLKRKVFPEGPVMREQLGEKIFGVLLEFRRPAWLWLRDEAGIHARPRGNDQDTARVEVLPHPLDLALPDPAIIRKGFVQESSTRFYAGPGKVSGPRLTVAEVWNLPDGPLSLTLEELLRRLRVRRFREMIQG